MKLTIIRVIAVLLIIAAVGLYAYGVLVNGENPTQNLPRTIIIALSGVSALMKTFTKRRALSTYASAFTKELGSAFAEDTKKRERLLEAVRLFDEDKNGAALKVLESLKLEARTRDEHYAVGLFTALCQTDLGLHEAAITTYKETAARGAVSSQLYSNMGAQYAAIEDIKNAMDAYHKAIELDPENPLPYSNIANLAVTHDAFEVAIAAGKSALEINPGQYQAASAVAMAYAAMDNEAEMKKYIDMAVKAGQDAKTLQNACNHYAMKAQAETAAEA